MTFTETSRMSQRTTTPVSKCSYGHAIMLSSHYAKARFRFKDYGNSVNTTEDASAGNLRDGISDGNDDIITLDVSALFNHKKDLILVYCTELKDLSLGHVTFMYKISFKSSI